MAKTLSESPIASKAARAKLGAGLHWRGIDRDVHLGYRRGARGGRWLVRWYVGDQAYRQETLGTADDAFAADDINALTFEQAVRKARETVTVHRSATNAVVAGPPLTVARAIDSYLAQREATEAAQFGSAVKRDARSRLTKHVLRDELAGRVLGDLTEEDLEGWMRRLPTTLAPATVRRLVNDLKAAMNLAGRSYRVRLPASLPTVVRVGLSVPKSRGDEARKQILSDDEVRRLVGAAQAVDIEQGWEGDLARLVVVLAATGARFSQVIRLAIADFQPAEGRLMIPTSRKGRGSKIDRIAVRIGEDVAGVLLPAAAGRKSSVILLDRWKHKQTEVGEWVRDHRAPWRFAAEMTRPWRSIIASAELPKDTIPYALRHSSIVRGLKAGLPVRLVAGLHDTSAAMIERHYSAWIVDALNELSARAIIPLTAQPGRKSEQKTA